MKEIVTGEFIIFSIPESEALPMAIELFGPAFGYTSSLGSWLGEEEPGGVLRLPDKWLEPTAHNNVLEQTLRSLCSIGEQYVLYVDANRNATMLPTDIDSLEPPTAMGKLISITKEEAELQDHTQIGDLYFGTSM